MVLSHPFLNVVVAGAQIKGTIVFDRETWLPKRLTMKVFGTCEERWEFNDWRRMKVRHNTRNDLAGRLIGSPVRTDPVSPLCLHWESVGTVCRALVARKLIVQIPL